MNYFSRLLSVYALQQGTILSSFVMYFYISYNSMGSMQAESNSISSVSAMLKFVPNYNFICSLGLSNFGIPQLEFQCMNLNEPRNLCGESFCSFHKPSCF
jgi:hypothetical protein